MCNAHLERGFRLMKTAQHPHTVQPATHWRSKNTGMHFQFRLRKGNLGNGSRQAGEVNE
jgi:hypothetical protein